MEIDIRKSLLVKPLRELLTISACLIQNNKCKQQREKEIKMSIHLPHVQGTTEKQQRILRFHKIRSAFYTGSTLLKLLCKLKDEIATEGKNNIIGEIGCSNCKAVQLGESKWSLKSRSDGLKPPARNRDCGKNEIERHCWGADQRKLRLKESC